MPRGLYGPKRMSKVWQAERSREIARVATSIRRRKEANAKASLREHQDEQKAKQALREWNDKNRAAMQPRRSPEEQQRRLRDVAGIR